MRAHRGRQILVHRDFLSVADRINRYAVKNHLHLVITQSYRVPDKPVRNAIVQPAVKSNHLAGHALDFNMVYGGHVFESQEMMQNLFHRLPDAVIHFIRDIRADPLIRWGGDFTTPDPVHLDDGVNILNPEKWNAHYRECITDYANATPKWRRWVMLKRNKSGLDHRLGHNSINMQSSLSCSGKL